MAETSINVLGREPINLPRSRLARDRYASIADQSAAHLNDAWPTQDILKGKRLQAFESRLYKVSKLFGNYLMHPECRSQNTRASVDTSGCCLPSRVAT